jgi:hypothetical protein
MIKFLMIALMLAIMPISALAKDDEAVDRGYVLPAPDMNIVFVGKYVADDESLTYISGADAAGKQWGEKLTDILHMFEVCSIIKEPSTKKLFNNYTISARDMAAEKYKDIKLNIGDLFLFVAAIDDEHYVVNTVYGLSFASRGVSILPLSNELTKLLGSTCDDN